MQKELYKMYNCIDEQLLAMKIVKWLKINGLRAPFYTFLTPFCSFRGILCYCEKM